MPLDDRTVNQHAPVAEWRLTYDAPVQDPFDVIADATFRHRTSGIERCSPLWYAGGDSWGIRFTGEKLGEWTVRTTGPGALDGHEALVTVTPDGRDRPGFLETTGARWHWTGTDEPYVPHLVMGKKLDAYWSAGSVDDARIASDVTEFIEETGFTGFLQSSIAARWFDLFEDGEDTSAIGPAGSPDPRTFAVLETLIEHCYAAGAGVHLWVWGSDAHRVGWDHRTGPDGVGGLLGRPAIRLYRYLAGRLGPIPGWSAGLGFDIQDWTHPAGLRTWYALQKELLGGWPHPLGARADQRDDRDGESITRTPVRADPSAVFWTGGDYVGMYDYRVPFQWFRATQRFAEAEGLAVLQEDRFRIRDRERYEFKDYSPSLTRRGLWHAMMAGGVGAIWANLLPEPDHGGSQPYDNGATGSRQGESFVVTMKDEIAAWHRFWFDRPRFDADLEPTPEITAHDPGPPIWQGGAVDEPVTTALADPRQRRVIVYGERTDAVRLDLREMAEPQPALAMDTRTGETTDLGRLDPGVYDAVELPRASDWALAIGRFDVGA